MKKLGIVVLFVLAVVLFATSMVQAGPAFAQTAVSMSVRGSPTLTDDGLAPKMRIDSANVYEKKSIALDGSNLEDKQTHPSADQLAGRTSTVVRLVIAPATSTVKHMDGHGTFKGDGSARITSIAGTYNFTAAGVDIAWDTKSMSECTGIGASTEFKVALTPGRELSTVELGLLCSRPATWTLPSANTGEASAGTDPRRAASEHEGLGVSDCVAITTF